MEAESLVREALQLLARTQPPTATGSATAAWLRWPLSVHPRGHGSARSVRRRAPRRLRARLPPAAAPRRARAGGACGPRSAACARISR